MGAYPVSPIFFGNGITSAVVGAYRLMSRIWFTVSVSGCSHHFPVFAYSTIFWPGEPPATRPSIMSLLEDPAGSACGMRVNVIEGALLLWSRRQAWHSTTGTMPSTRRRLSVMLAQLTQVSHILCVLIFPSYWIRAGDANLGADPTGCTRPFRAGHQITQAEPRYFASERRRRV